MTRPLVLCDLDRTLIYSRAAIGVAPPPLCLVERHKDADASWLTARAAKLVEQLRERAEVVPCTTRTRQQYARVRLPGGPAAYAITTNGGHLLVDGASDREWRRKVKARLGECAPLDEVRARLLDPAHAAWLRRDRVAEDLFCYAIVERDRLQAGHLDALTRWAGERGWAVSLQGRKLYLVPRVLTKSAAAAELAGRLGAPVVLAAGDSLLDTDLLEYADLAVRPAHGELEQVGWTPRGLHVTNTAGVRAGEELLGWLLAQVRAATT